MAEVKIGSGVEKVLPATGTPDRSVHEYVIATDRNGERILACARCGTRFCGYAGNYKAGALVDEGSVSLIPSAQDPSAQDPSDYVDENIVFRRYCCPGCHVQIAAEMRLSARVSH